MLTRRSLATVLSSAFTASLLLATPVLAVDPVDRGLPIAEQHGDTEGHLLGPGEWGKIELIDVVELYDPNDPAFGRELIADVGVDPDGDYAYLANWGFPDCAGPEAGGQKSPDAGIYIVDISGIGDPTDPDFEPAEVGFIPTPQDTRPGEGVQVAEITTSFFSGEILAFNHEGCGKNYKGGFSLWDVSDPTKPKRLATGIGDRTVDGSRRQISDANETHSIFIWDAGDRAYLVAQDEWETSDIDIFDITNPRRPVLISEVDLTQTGQPELGLSETMLHDMVVKQIGGRYIMLASYWDGGYALLDVTDPANPVLLGDTEYAAIDPLLFEETGVELPPEGNGHQAEFAGLNNEFIISTDEDFDPYKLFATIDGVALPLSVGVGVDATGTEQTVPQLEPGDTVTGPTLYVGRACDPAAIPAAPSGDAIAVIERGDCDFQVKLANVEAAGYDAAVIFNNETGSPACEGTLNMIVAEGVVTIPSYFVGRSTGYALLGIDGYNTANCPGGANPALPAVGTATETVTLSSAFDGWGYVHLIDNDPESDTYLQSVDQYAIPEAHDPAFATGFGDLSVHEVAVDPQDRTLAYLSYYAGGLRAVQIQCTDPNVANTCELVEVGGYLDEAGNNFWGVETFVGDDGFTYIAASDRDSGLWIFRDP